MPKTTFDTIFCPPVNSSGDVYHIGAYLIICTALNKTVPQVILFCDTDETEEQAKRAKSFLAALSFGNVRIYRFVSKSYQANPRLKISTDAVRSYSDSAVDQKTTTSLISYYIMLYGDFITSSISKHIANIAMKSKGLPAYTWANKKIAKIIKEIDIINKKFVIINLRASNKANSDQDFTQPQLRTLAKSLKLQDIQMVILDVGDNTGRAFSSSHQDDEYAANVAIGVFPTIKELHKNYGKFPHIFLLQQLARLETCLGVIGNTSGTLDIAAFMGIRTLCLHKFKANSSRNIIIPYQDLRILLQANTMSVYDPALGLNGLVNIVNKWLSYKQNILCHNQANLEKIKLEKNNFDMDYVERKCFAVDSNGKTVNPVFSPQYKQVKCDQKLSTVMSKRIAASDSHATLREITCHSKDDLCMPKQPVRRARKNSLE